MVMPKIYLTEAIDSDSILRILTQSNPINKADPKYNYYKKLAVWANSNRRQLSIKNVDLNTIKLSDRGLLSSNKLNTRYNSLGSLLDALKNLMDSEGSYKSARAKLIQQTTLEILASLSKIPDNTEEEKPQLYEGMDWTAEKAKRLANAKEPTSEVLEKFYNDYYNIEYAGGTSAKAGDPNIVSKLKSLDKILIPEFNALGYNPTVNPLAQFLKILIKQKRDIFNKLTTNTYGAIHNSFIAHAITGNMLGNYSETNILFCTDLYNYKGLDIVNYLVLQNQTNSELKKDSKHSSVKNLIAKMFIQQSVSGDTYEEKINNLLELENVILPSAPEAKLRSELEIRELYRYLFGHDAEEIRKSDISKIVQESAGKNAILDMVYYLISQYKLKADFETEVSNWLKDTKYKPENKKIAESKEILAKYSNMELSEITALIDKLRAYYIKKQREEKKET